MPPARPRDATEDHPGPSRPSITRGREVLIVCFPVSRAVPLPVPGEAIGRDWIASKASADARVSTQHATFHRAGGKLFIEDLGSRNGTYVEGMRIRPKEHVAVEDGMRIRIGRTLFVYRDGFMGSDQPSPDLGDLVGPFGLREVAAALETLGKRATVDERPCHRNVLIEGETGTGKELLARAVATELHRTRPYIAINVAGVPAGVFESQLFGYVPGAYSGSGKGSRGVLLDHERGAVFLDEIGELPMELQPKLLRFLENRDVQAVGANRTVQADVLIIAATLRSLEELANTGHFRADLLARFNARLELPPLRDRSEDLFAIMQKVVSLRGERFDPQQVEIESIERLALQPWPRNVRELASTLERIAALAPPPALPYWAVERVLGPLESVSHAPLTQETVERALESCDNNESAAARKLGITRARLRRFLKKA